MDDITQLRYRNTALETELRIIKEQLVQAHGATNFLVTTFSTQRAQHERNTVDRLQTRLDETLAENTQLRGTLQAQCMLSAKPTALQHTITSKAQQAYSRELQFRLPPSPALTSEQQVASGSHGTEDIESADLLSFEDGEGSVSPADWASLSPGYRTVTHDSLLRVSSLLDTPPSPTCTGQIFSDTRSARPRHNAIGLGISNIHHKTQSVLVPAALHSTAHINKAEASHTIKHADGSTSVVMLTPDSPSPTQSATNEPSPPPHAPTGPRCNFVHFERLYLLGQACWIEDMDGDEYAAQWEYIAKKKGRHTAEEWQDFYERVIRPAYYEKQAAKAEAMAVAEDDGDLAKGDAESEGAKEAVAKVAARHAESVERADSPMDIGADLNEQEAEAADDGVTVEEPAEKQPTGSDTDASLESDKAVQPTPEAQPGVQGLAASRWAPKAVETEVVGGLEAEPRVDAGLTDGASDLPTIEEFCAEQKGSVKRVEAGQEGVSQDPSMIPPTDLQQKPSGSRTAGPDILGQRTAPAPRSGYAGGRLVRVGYIDNRPRCCHWPWESQQLLHSNFPHDPSTLRTIMISNIPPNITLAEVLDKVRGGKIISATYLLLSGMKTKPVLHMNAVMVTFLYANDAKAYTEFCEKNFTFFWSEKFDALFKATITHVQTPVRPPSSFASIPQIRNEGLTRSIFLLDDGTKSPENVINAVLGLLAQKCGKYYEHCNYPLRTGRHEDGVLFFEFASVEDAVIFKRAMESLNWEFGGISKGFLPDPCESALEGLKTVAEARKPAKVMESADHGSDTESEISSVELGESEYTVKKETANIPVQDVAGGVAASGTLATLPSSDLVTVPRTGWNMGGDLEAAKAFLGAVKKNYARGRTPTPRAMPAEVLKEGEAIGAEG